MNNNQNSPHSGSVSAISDKVPPPTHPGVSQIGLVQPPPQSKAGVTGSLCFSVFAAVLGMFNFGYNTGVINAPQKLIQSFINETQFARTGQEVSQSTLNILWGVTVSLFAIGGMFGGVLGGWWADRFGRKRGMLLNTVIGILGAVFMGFSQLAKSFEMIIIGRIIVGFNCGLYTGLSPLYNSEIAPLHLRGALGTVNQLAVTLGILISQVLGLNEIIGTDKLWPLLLALTGIPPLIQMVALPFCPESPRYLLLTKQQLDEATQALIKLRGTPHVDDELEEMRREEAANQEEAQISMLELLKSSSLRLPLVISVVMHLSQQLSGINVVFYYSTSLFTEAGLAQNVAKYVTLFVGAIMVIMTFVTIPLMERVGRRKLHLTGLVGMMIFSVAFTITFELRTKVDAFKYVSVASALVFVFFFAMGPGSIPWMIVAELFAQGPRTAAISIAVLVNWFCNFLVGILFPPMQTALKGYTFLPFTALILIFFIFLFKFLPETKGKTIEEISAIFKNRTSKGTSPEGNQPYEGTYRSLGEDGTYKRNGTSEL